MAKVQFNLYLDSDLRDAIIRLARQESCRGPSDLIARKVMGFVTGDLNSILESLQYALTTADGPVDMVTLEAIQGLVDTFLVTKR